jgi:GAF domain-containing protein/anti-sigma regulatory factor (Ser/Thr protein kinase)
LAEGTLLLGAEPDAVPYARRWVADALAAGPVATILPDAELVVSELVTNAVLHAGPPISVQVEVHGETVRITVADGSRATPVRALARADAMTGRGLSLVAALARDWGVEATPSGKIVWCELSAAPPARAAGTGAGTDVDDEDVDVDALLASWADLEPKADDVRRYTVELGDVPTDLLLGAKAHVDNLVREFTLAARGAASGRTAEVPPQLAELIEAVVSGFSEARQSIKRQALDAASRGADRTTLTLTLPLDAADAGERYLAALDEADAYARAARLLTLETPPQHKVFRRWYVESLIVQLRQAASGEETHLPTTFERRLLDELAVVATAQRNSERAARLFKVTAALAGTVTTADVAHVVVSEGVIALGASGGTLLVPEDDHLEVPATVGYDDALVARLRAERRDAELPAATAIRTRRNVWLESREERDEQFPELVGLEPGTVSMCAVPLVAGENILGALRFSFDSARLFDADERNFVQTLAAQTAQALERAQALEALRYASGKLAFLADASAELAASLDYRTTLRKVARLAVPRLADWCVVHVLEDGELQPIELTHVDPAQVAAAEEHQRRYPVGMSDPGGVAEVVRSGASQLYPEITDAMLVAGARDPEHLERSRALALTSAVIVPLAARDRVFGAITLCYAAESGRHYDEGDLLMAEDLAHRAALAIDNATLFRQLTERTGDA